jgi:hypothetical protein
MFVRTIGYKCEVVGIIGVLEIDTKHWDNIEWL